MRDNSLGIFVRQEKKFYYLESGAVFISNTVDRLKKALSKRNLIKFNPQGAFLDTTDYQVITCSEAQLSDYEMIPIYISKHIETLVKNKTDLSADKSSWGQK